MIETQLRANCLAIKIQVNTLDAANANAFKDEVKTHLNSAIESAELDLSAVEFMDSSGIGAVLSVYKQLDTQLILLNPQPAVLSILELLRLHRVFKIETRAN